MSWFGYVWIVMAAIFYIIWTIVAIYALIKDRKGGVISFWSYDELAEIYTWWLVFTIGFPFLCSLIYWLFAHS